MAHIWVVEIRENGKWVPTASGHLTKREAEAEKAYRWEYNNPDDRFRVRKYERTYSKVVVYEHDGGR